MLYGTKITEKYREGNQDVVITRYSVYEEVTDESEALSYFIAFLRDVSTHHYRDPCFRPIYKAGKLHRIMKEYEVFDS